MIRTLASVLALAPSITLANDLAHLSDDFSSDTSTSWRLRHITEGGEPQLERWAINPADAPGQMLMMPSTTTWYQPWRGPLVYKDVSGDFAITTRVTASNRAGTGTPASQYSLAGLMLRVAPDPVESPDNYVFLSIGHGTGGQPQFEVKSTIDGTSRLVLTNAESLVTDLQLARVGDKIITLYRRPQDPDWLVHRVYDSDSLDPFFDHNLGSGPLQVGLVTYTDWQKAQTFDPAYHNLNNLTDQDNAQSSIPTQPFAPDLVARFDHAIFHCINLPGGFPENATDADYLAVLGDNVVPEPTAGLMTLALACATLTRRRPT